MDILTRSQLRDLLLHHGAPTVSLYMPTHPGGSEQDAIRAKNLLRSAEELLLSGGLAVRDVRKLLDATRRHFEDPLFWRKQCNGLACFLAPNFARQYRLPLAFAELVVVANQFDLRPLLPLLCSDGRYYVLALSQNNIRLFQGTAHSIDAVDLTGVPTSLAETLKFSDRSTPTRLLARRPGGAGEWGRAFHGEGVGVVDLKDDLLDYFQQIDRGLHDFLRTEHVPLVLASVAHLWPIYREANSYPHLVEQGIAGNPDHWTNRELHDKAWAIVGTQFQQNLHDAANLYSQLAGTGRTTNDVAEAVTAALQGRIEIAFVALDGAQWGAYGPSGGNVVLHDKKQPGDSDLLDVVANHVLLRGGVVYAVPAAEVPGGGSLAAIFWLPRARKMM